MEDTSPSRGKRVSVSLCVKRHGKSSLSFLVCEALSTLREAASMKHARETVFCVRAFAVAAIVLWYETNVTGEIM